VAAISVLGDKIMVMYFGLKFDNVSTISVSVLFRAKAIHHHFQFFGRCIETFNEKTTNSFENNDPKGKFNYIRHRLQSFESVSRGGRS
jgi:alpha-amylase/alpha-mannosidase (GH57 family)